ncbi:MAG: RNA methyltransferase [Candidatus Tectomicrobia bacterium]|uniref:tRNA (cytidine/uridine-2'-O-)-methyltransferase TrmJ n=1 Tax=Tectimicrobiota bacterium TaxID=2528274 RepID=A0A932GSF5_UNCTE|nr:RNA methyltransferase [Candidatus Tectomicrobia bacterium]
MDSITIVLVRPQGSANVGAVARAMANTGFRRLVLVDPCDYLCDEALKMALRARPLLERARVAEDLREALAGAGFVVGTSCRLGQARGPAAFPRELAPRILEFTGRAEVAIVFGPEDRGLTNEELSLCHELLTVPTHPEFPSLNLAQAVMLVCYEIYVCGHTQDAGTHSRVPILMGAEPSVPDRTLAASRDLEELYAQMESTLNRIRFLNPQNPGHMMTALRRIFGRALLDEREVRILRGIFHQFDWYIAYGRDREKSSRIPPEPSNPPR